MYICEHFGASLSLGNSCPMRWYTTPWIRNVSDSLLCVRKVLIIIGAKRSKRKSTVVRTDLLSKILPTFVTSGQQVHQQLRTRSYRGLNYCAVSTANGVLQTQFSAGRELLTLPEFCQTHRTAICETAT